MKILFVTRSLPFHHLGGMESVAWDLARSLVTRNHDVEILTTKCSHLPKDASIEGVLIKTMNVPSGKYSASYWQETRRLFRSDYMAGFDVILSVGAGAYGIASERRTGSSPRLVMQSHGQAWGELVSKLAVPSPLSWLKAIKNVNGIRMDHVLRNFDRIVAIGPAVQRVLESAPTKWMLSGTPVVVIPNGINDNLFTFDATARAEHRARLNIASTATVTVSASRLHIQKGLRETIAGFAKAKDHRSDLIHLVIGSGPAENDLRNLAKSLGVSDSVRFVGAVNRQDLPGMLSVGDLFLFTSKRQEGLALGPLEAAATGLPCILSNHLAVAGLDALEVNPNDPNSIANAIHEKLREVSGSSRSSILPKEYTLEHSTTLYEQLFQDLI